MKTIRVYLNREGAAKLPAHRSNPNAVPYVSPLANNGDFSEDSPRAWLKFYSTNISEDGRLYRDMSVFEAIGLIPLLEERGLFGGVSEAVMFQCREEFPLSGTILLGKDGVLVLRSAPFKGEVSYGVAYADTLEALSRGLRGVAIESSTHTYEYPGRDVPEFQRGALRFKARSNRNANCWIYNVLAFELTVILGTSLLLIANYCGW